MALLVFDLDGTLVDSYKGLAISMNKVLIEMGYEPHSEVAYKHFVGNGIAMLVERALPAEGKRRLDEAIEKMIQHYQVDYQHELKVYPGIYDLLDQLVKGRHSLALITNKFQFMADVIMEQFFKAYDFGHIIGRDDCYPAKPDPTSLLRVVEENGYTLDQTWMIGDTEVDIETARNAGVREVFVTWGFRDLEEIQHYQPKVVIHKANELLEWVR